MEQHIVIIGNGIAGVSAARHIRKHSKAKVTIISAETDHFFSRTALMYVFMGHMKYEHTKPYEDGFWKKNKIDLVRAYVEAINFDKKSLTLDKGDSIQYDKLILATGSKPNRYGWPGQESKGVQGLYSYQDLELMEVNTKNCKHAVVIGGGLIGIEMAEMLLSRNIKVTFLVREDSFWNTVLPAQSSDLINRHIRLHQVDLRLSTELAAIIADKEGNAIGVKTKTGEEIDCDFVGITVGVSPNIDFLKDTALTINKGIVVNEYLETNIPDVYAIGDCAEQSAPAQGRRAIEQVWYTGRIMGETLARTLTGNRTKYQPGIWFNSAKFFDIEYQTYGLVNAARSEEEEELYWEHSDGQKSLHFIYDKKNHRLIGVNAFGIRLRHHCFDQWLAENATIAYVLENLGTANFDPEFFERYEQVIVDIFNKQHPEHAVVLKSKKGLLARLFA